MKYSQITVSAASRPITGLDNDAVLIVLPKGLVRWTIEAVEAEIIYWQENSDEPESQSMLAQFRALLKSLSK
jgi:hypothetical protein